MHQPLLQALHQFPALAPELIVLVSHAEVRCTWQAPSWGSRRAVGSLRLLEPRCAGQEAECSFGNAHNFPRRQGKWVSGRWDQWLLKCLQGRFPLGCVSGVRIMCILWALYSYFCKERSSHMLNIWKDFNKLFTRKKIILNNYVFSIAHEYININGHIIIKILGLTQQVWFMALCNTLWR